MANTRFNPVSAIKALDSTSVHRISSGQVVVDLQTAVKELLENSLDAGATNIEVRFKDHGLDVFEVVDNGSGIAPEDYDAIALKHHTSKISAFSDLAALSTFGFRGEALSSLCALADSVTVTTATAADAPMGTVVEFDRAGRVVSRSGKVARQRGTTVTVAGLFKPLPVRRKELERNAKREFGKALALLSAYAVVPCAQENRGVRLTVTHQPSGGKKAMQLRTDGSPSTRASVSALWGPKVLEHLVQLDLRFTVEIEKAVLRRQGLTDSDGHSNDVRVRGLVSKFAVSCGRASTDRQFFFINGRPCNPSKVQKAFNEVYRTFNANQVPFVIADFILPTDSCDVNVSPDKRTILLHSEKNLVQALKSALEEAFAPARATYDVNDSQAVAKHGSRAKLPAKIVDAKSSQVPLFLDDDDGDDGHAGDAPSSQIADTPDADDGGRFGEPQLLTVTQPTTPAEVPAMHEPSEAVLSSSPPRSNSAPAGHQSPTATLISLSYNEPDTLASLQKDVDVDLDHHGPAARRDIEEDVEEEVQFLHSSTVTRMPPASEANSVARSPTVAQLQRNSPTDEATHPPTVTQVHAALIDGRSPSPILVYSASNPIVSPAGGSRTHHLESSIGQKRPSATRDDSSLGGSHSVQMVLSTSGTAWDLHAGSPDPERESKRRRLEGGTARDTRQAREGLRSRLREFARTGSQIVDVDMDDEEREGEGDNREQSAPHDGVVDDASREAEDVAMDVDVETEVRGGDVQTNVPEDEVTSTQAIDEGVAAADDSASSAIKQAASTSDSATPSVSPVPPGGSHPEILRSANTEDVSIHLSLSGITMAWRSLQKHLSVASRAPAAVLKLALDADASVRTEDDTKAVEALSRVIDKTDFNTMEVIGQFNLGFIIARRHKKAEDDASEMDDLFIVDQHAADEKYNFETLQQTTKLESQKLFRPLPLELTAADELLATDKVDMLRQNGFEIDITEEPSGGDPRLHLVAQPVSKSTVFDVKDTHHRPGRIVASHARCAGRADGALLQSARHVCHARVPQERYGRHAADAPADGFGRAPHGYDGPAMALPAWQANNASPL